MFKIQDINPDLYRKQTRKATLIMMAIFIVIGFASATLFVTYLGAFSNNKFVLNMMGAALGLIITAFIVKTYFAHKPWMKEAIYGWQLKRNLMQIGNVLRQVKTQADKNDVQALKILRFYHLGLEQMHRFDNNNTALIDLAAEKQTLAQQMTEQGVDVNQLEFTPEWLAPYNDTTE